MNMPFDHPAFRRLSIYTLAILNANLADVDLWSTDTTGISIARIVIKLS